MANPAEAADAAVQAAKNKAATNKAPTRKASAKSAPADAEGTKGVARPRKHDYGIIPEAKIEVVMEEEKIPALRGDLTGALTLIGKGMTYEKYLAEGGERAHIRRLARKGVIELVHPDGTRYPKEYVKPEPKAETPADEG